MPSEQLRIRCPEDTGASSRFKHRRTPAVSSGHRGILRMPSVSWGYAVSPGHRRRPGDTLISWGCHRCPEDTGSFRQYKNYKTTPVLALYITHEAVSRPSRAVGSRKFPPHCSAHSRASRVSVCVVPGAQLTRPPPPLSRRGSAWRCRCSWRRRWPVAKVGMLTVSSAAPNKHAHSK